MQRPMAGDGNADLIGQRVLRSTRFGNGFLNFLSGPQLEYQTLLVYAVC